MRLVSIEQARPGAVLAENVKDRRGRLLIPAEARLSARQIESLQMWGVTHICIEGSPTHTVTLEALDPEVLGAIVESLDDHFSNVDLGHPLIAALHECAVDHEIAASVDGGGRG